MLIFTVTQNRTFVHPRFQWSAEKVVSFFLLSLFHCPNLTWHNIFCFSRSVSVPWPAFVSSELWNWVFSQNKCAAMPQAPLLCHICRLHWPRNRPGVPPPMRSYPCPIMLRGGLSSVIMKGIFLVPQKCGLEIHILFQRSRTCPGYLLPGQCCTFEGYSSEWGRQSLTLRNLHAIRD